MPTLSVNKNKQGQTTIPKELIEALGWQGGDKLLMSKAPSQKYIVVENISKEGHNVKVR